MNQNNELNLEVLNGGEFQKGNPPPNRAQRREQMRAAQRQLKNAPTQEQKLSDLKRSLGVPATIDDVVKISTAVAQDIVNEYHRQSNPIVVGMSLHIEILKNKLIQQGILNQEDFDKLFEESVAEFNRLRKEQLIKAESEAHATETENSSKDDTQAETGESEDEDLSDV